MLLWCLMLVFGVLCVGYVVLLVLLMLSMILNFSSEVLVVMGLVWCLVWVVMVGLFVYVWNVLLDF